MDNRQEEQAHPTKGVVRKEQPAGVISIGQPPTDQSANKVEQPHHRKPVRSRHFSETMLGCVCDEVLTNETVTRHTAHHECSGKQPKFGSTSSASKEPFVGRFRWLWSAAIRGEPDVSRSITH